ncbi:MAG: hypothetical protein ACRD2L_13055 [Terriglobia bacterium]
MTQTSSKAAAWLNRNSDFAASLDADETEFAALRFGSVNIEEGLRDEKRVGAIADNSDLSKPRWIALATETEEATGKIAEELRRRSGLLGPTYPFTVSGNTLRYAASRSGVYEFCLAATVTESLTKKPFNKLPVAFERLCREISLLLFGSRSVSVRTGWPRDKNDGLPLKAKALFGKIEAMTGEWTWNPEPDLPTDPSPKYFKELGLDLLTWIPMPDGRVGHAFILGQCTCGKTDWFEKRKEPDIALLRRWFRPLMAVQQPLKCLFVPFHISNIGALRDVTTAGVTLDRARICLLAEDHLHASESAKGYWEFVRLVAGPKIDPPAN